MIRGAPCSDCRRVRGCHLLHATALALAAAPVLSSQKLLEPRLSDLPWTAMLLDPVLGCCPSTAPVHVHVLAKPHVSLSWWCLLELP